VPAGQSRCGSRPAGTAAPGCAADLHRHRRLAVPGIRYRHAGRAAGHLEARHRAHARIEDRIRTGKITGLGRFPSRQFNLNAVWLELGQLAADLIAWTQTTLLDGELARCEPQALRYRLLHVAARITRGQRRLWLRIAAHWPWRHQLAAAFARLAILPTPLRT
jgi:hypothetical protein